MKKRVVGLTDTVIKERKKAAAEKAKGEKSNRKNKPAGAETEKTEDAETGKTEDAETEESKSAE